MNVCRLEGCMSMYEHPLPHACKHFCCAFVCKICALFSRHAAVQSALRPRTGKSHEEAQSSETETTFHYCWRVKSSFKLVWMESTSLVWPKSLLSKTGFDRLERDQSSLRQSAPVDFLMRHYNRFLVQFNKLKKLKGIGSWDEYFFSGLNDQICSILSVYMRRCFSIFKAAFLVRNLNIEILLASMKTLILILTISREFIPFFCVSFATMRDCGRLFFYKTHVI